MKLPIVLAAVLLSGCATAPRPQMMVIPHKTPVIKAAPVVIAPTAPATFKQRWYTRFRKHPIKWLH